MLVRGPQRVTPTHHSFLPPLVYQILWMVRVSDGHGTFHHLLHQCMDILTLTPHHHQELDTPSLLPPPLARPHSVVVNLSIWLLPKHFNLVDSSFVFPVCLMSFQYLWSLSLTLSTLFCDCWSWKHYIYLSLLSTHPPTCLHPTALCPCVCVHTHKHTFCVFTCHLCVHVSDCMWTCLYFWCTRSSYILSSHTLDPSRDLLYTEAFVYTCDIDGHHTHHTWQERW